MARRFLDDIKADIATQMADNVVGSFTLALDRALRVDEIDSGKDDEAILTNTSAQVGAVIPATWGAFTFTGSKGGDASFLIVDVPGGKITTSPVPGFTYTVEGFITLSAATNVVIELAVGVNGVPLGYLGAFTGRGTSRPGSANSGYFETALPANTAFQLLVQTAGGGTADISSATLTVVVKPTNNP